MTTLRLLLADDHALFRAGLRLLLRGIADTEVVAEAADGDDAIALAKQYRPDLVLMDISMKGRNGIEATEQIRRLLPETRVIMLSMLESEDFIAHALRAGASGYLLKDSAEAELELALAAVTRGETYLSPRVSKHLVEAYLRSAPLDVSPLGLLSARQREILRMIAEGRSTKQIAYDLGVSVKTVETHRAQIMERLDIHDVPGLVRFAIRNGLISSDADRSGR
jgi:DNA-binding NarL/FixJ family response regulator